MYYKTFQSLVGWLVWCLMAAYNRCRFLWCRVKRGKGVW